MYDSLTFYLYEGSQFELKSDRFFDGWTTKKIDGKFDIKTRFVSNLRKKVWDSKRYYPLIDLTEPVIGSVKTGKRRVKRLEIQTSLPKSRFGTSKYEIGFEDFEMIIQRNLEFLTMADVITDVKTLKEGILAELAVPKSIIMPSYFGTAVQTIRKLSIFDQKPRSKFRVRDYENGTMGFSFNFNNDISGTCGYCKYSEIVRNGYTFEEEEVRESVLGGQQRKDMFRLEKSYFRKQTLEAVLRRVIPNKKKDFTLNDIFANGNISQKLLLEEFDEVFSPINTALISFSEMKDNQLEFILKSGGLDFNERSLMYYMVNMAIKFGLNQLWTELREEMSEAKFYRTRKKVLEIVKKLEEFKEPTTNLVGFLRAEIEKFDLIKPPVKISRCQQSLKNI